MPKLIEKLLMSRVSDKELYKALAKETVGDLNQNGGLGSTFRPKTRYKSVEGAFFIDDQKKIVSVKSIEKLYALAQDFKHNTLVQNSCNYALCLALICNRSTDLRYTKYALDELADLYSFDKKKAEKKSILDLIKLKQEAHDAILKTTMVANEKVIHSPEKLKKNSNHEAEFVRIDGQEYVRKRKVASRVAELEVFSGTMMELFIGEYQPITRQEDTKELADDRKSESVPVLSERVDFVAFRDKQVLKEWANLGFPGAAEIDVASLFMAEDDFHRGNVGLLKKIKMPVRIDFDRTLAPLSLLLFDEYYALKHKEQFADGKCYITKSLGALDCLGIHEEDLTQLPILPMLRDYQIGWSTFDKDKNLILRIDPKKIEEAKQHFMPSRWWATIGLLNPELQSKINALATQTEYIQAKFCSILEKIIMPMELIEQIANLSIFNEEDKKCVIDWMARRQQKIAEVALKVPGFIEFIKNHGTEAKEKLKNRLAKFMEKRKDLFQAQSHLKFYYHLYDKNFDNYSVVIQKESPVSLSKPKLSTTKVISAMGIEAKKRESQEKEPQEKEPQKKEPDQDLKLEPSLMIRALPACELADCTTLELEKPEMVPGWI